MTKLMAAAAGLAAILAAYPVNAQTKIQIGCTATSDCASASVAVHGGRFKKQGLDAETVPVRVNSDEVTFPTMADIIKSGGVDAVLTAEPFVTRMTNAGLGTVGARYGAELARTEPIIFYAAARDWAEQNPDAIKKFRDAIAEGAAIVNSDRDKASDSVAKFTKQPTELVKPTLPNQSEPGLKAEQLSL